MTTLPYAYAGAPLRGALRASPDDFFVDEQLGFEPDGAGEHVFLRIEKRGANTDWIARELAKFAGVPPMNVSYSGIKDRHAVTRQTFSVHMPGKKPEPDWRAFDSEERRVLSSARHSRKLKRGAHKSNAFKIVVRDVTGDRGRAESIVHRIAAHGVPNYFGEQRFGRGAANVARALAMFAGKRVQRHERSLLLSAARSEMFNRVLAERVTHGNWNTPLEGEVWMLRGTHSIFGPEPITAEMVERCGLGDIQPTGPLWGEGDLRTTADALRIERQIGEGAPKLIVGLQKAGLRHERRSLVLMPENLATEWLAENVFSIQFELAAGAYATVVLREICADGVQPTMSGIEESES
jgi:tRNA pseudouridine13 synthase